MHVDRCDKEFLFSLLESYACVDICYKEVQLSPTEPSTCLVRSIRESCCRPWNNMHFWYVCQGIPTPPCRWGVGDLCLHGLGLRVGMVFWCWGDGICWNSCVYMIGRSAVSSIQSTCSSFLRPQPCAHEPHPTYPTLSFNTPNSIPHPPFHPLPP